MRRIFSKSKIFIGILLLAVGLYVTTCGGTQPEPESYTLGVIILIPPMEPALDGIKSGLAERGYIEGKNIAFLYDGPLGSLEAVEEAAQRFVEADVDAIISISTPPTQIAQRVTAETDIPIIFGATDPVGSGLVQSLAHPGGNATGIATGFAEDLRLEWLLRVAPQSKRIYAPYNPADPSAIFALGMTREAAEKLDVELITPEVRTPEDVAEAIKKMPADVDAIFWLPDSLVTAAKDAWGEAVMERKLPMSGAGFPPPDGVVVSYGFTLFDAGKQLGRLTAQVLQGAEPADLPAETVEFFLGINLKAAQAIGLDIPEEVLQAADSIIR